MSTYDNKLLLETRQTLPSKVAESVQAFSRAADPYGAQASRDVDEPRQNCDEGSYFIQTTLTPGTGIIAHASLTAYDATKPTLLVKNNNAAGGKRLYLDYIRLLESVAGAAATSFRYRMHADSVERYGSGGTALGAAASSVKAATNPNMDSSASSAAQVYFGAVTANAAGSGERLLSNGVLRQGLGVAGDQFTFLFGGGKQMGASMLTPLTTVMQDKFIPVHPVVLGPGQSFLLHIFGAALTTAVTFELEMGYVER
jgi:hypothetical protein